MFEKVIIIIFNLRKLKNILLVSVWCFNSGVFFYIGNRNCSFHFAYQPRQISGPSENAKSSMALGVPGKIGSVLCEELQL